MPTTYAIPETVRVQREHIIDGDRYQFDFSLCSYRKGWAQCDTKCDAPYYGAWANPTQLKYVTYCEGDVAVFQCDNAVDFVQVVRHMAEWAKENAGGFAIDGMCRPEIIDAFHALGLGDLLH